MTKKSKMSNISELLPDSLSEETLNQIAKLVQQTITEEVEARTKLLEAKVMAFIRGRVDMLKEQAISELEEENDTFRSARRFNALKSLMALELGSDDEDSAVGKAVHEAADLQEENTVLVEELTKAVEGNELLESQLATLTDKVARLVEDNTQVRAELTSANHSKLQLTEEALNEETRVGKKKVIVNSSERAIVISEADKQVSDPRYIDEEVNGLISDDVMGLMPQNDEDLSF